MRDRERQRPRQKEKQAPCREPNVGLDPGTLGSCPEPKADAQPLSHPGIPIFLNFYQQSFIVFFFFFFKILFIHERQREAET